MKTATTIFIIFLIRMFCLGDETCVFTVLEIAGEKELAEIKEIIETNGIKFNEDIVNRIYEISSVKIEKKVEITDGVINVEELYPVQYAKKDGDTYDLVQSDSNEGLLCKMNVTNSTGKKSTTYFFDGELQFYGVAERENFTPFPASRIGKPIRIMGITANNGFVIRANKASMISFYIISSGGLEKTAVLVLVSVKKGVIVK